MRPMLVRAPLFDDGVNPIPPPSFVGITGGSIANAGSVNISTPGGSTASTKLYAFVTSTVAEGVFATGWTEVCGVLNGSLNMHCLTRTHDGSSSSYSIEMDGGGSASGLMLAYNGAGEVNEFTMGTVTSTATPSFPAIVTPVSSCVLVGAWGAGEVTALSGPVDWTVRGSLAETDEFILTQVFDKVISAPTSVPSGVATDSWSGSRITNGLVIAIEPA